MTVKLHRTSASAILLTVFSLVAGAPAASGQKLDRNAVAPDGRVSSVILATVREKTAGGPVSQTEVADAVLADALRKADAQIDHHFDKGEYNACINLNRVIVQADPHDLTGYANSAYLLWSTGRVDDALAFLRAGISANPTTFYLWDEMGTAYIMYVKDPKSAIGYYEKAVQYPCPWSTWHALANCYEKTNQWQKAVNTWKSAASKYPEDLLAPRRLARAKARLASRPGNG